MSSKDRPLSPAAFFTTQLSLLEAEQATEVAENTLLLSSASPATLSRVGLAVTNLNIASLKTGLGGRTVVELVADPAYTTKSSSEELPQHGIRTGDIVRVGEIPKGNAKKKEVADLKSKGVEGVVTRVDQRAIYVAAGKASGDGNDNDSDLDTLSSSRVWLVKLANDVTYKRMNWALNKMLKTTEGQLSSLQRVLLGLNSPGTADAQKMKQDLTFVNTTLNQSQQDAIKFALASPDLALIHGPPGTGKTSTIVELVLQLLKQDQRVLVCGPSNISVDNIVERLAVSSPSTPIVRMGHPARLLASVLDHSLEVLTKTSDAGAIVKDIRDEIDQKIASTKKTKNGRERRLIWQDVRELRKEFRQREDRCVETLVGGSAVVLATLHGAGSRQITAGKTQGKGGFDVIVIDEAGQGLEAACWVPIVSAADSAKKLILAGDHLQLPPTVKSIDGQASKEELKQRLTKLEVELESLGISNDEIKQAKRLTLEHTMFDRLLAQHGPDIKRLLNVQYRMHEKIMRFPSDELYNSELVAADTVKTHLLSDLQGIIETDETTQPLVFYDTQGGNFPETLASSADTDKTSTLLATDSKSNPSEALLVQSHLRALIAAHLPAASIAVITPYTAQLDLLRSLLRPTHPNLDLELGSIDGFQGREKEAIILSLVRSNEEREVGFLAEKRRLNVAMTRARRHLCVIGDGETVARGSGFLKRWIEYLEEEADLRYPSPELLVG